MSIWTSVDVFSQRANGPQTLSMCSLYHIAAMGSHGDAQKAPWVAYGHAQSDSDDRLTANPGRLATTSLQHSTVYSSTAVLQSTTSTPPLWSCASLHHAHARDCDTLVRPRSASSYSRVSRARTLPAHSAAPRAYSLYRVTLRVA